MKRNKIIDIFNPEQLTDHKAELSSLSAQMKLMPLGYKKRVAFHEAGHAAGIHLNNKARQLPPVFFKIIFKETGRVTDADIMAYQTTHDDCIARVEGGRLIQSLPLSIESLVRTEHDDAMEQLVKDYTVAFEADVINLLIGPLAEAKHVAEDDGELFNNQLVHLKALKNYGGRSDLALVNEYLQSFSNDKQQIDEKLDQLFNAAFDFVNNDANWAAITKLADHILADDKNIIECEEIGSMLDESVDYFQNRRIAARSYLNG